MNQRSEALKTASEIELAITCGFIGSAAQYQHLLLSAVSQLRAPHAHNQELEKDLGNAKRLVSKIWNQHPEARGTIEEGTGAWMVFGQDVETGGVSAQRVPQAADHIAQDRKMVASQELHSLLARIEKEISTAQINNHHMAPQFGKMEGEPCVRISSLLATIEGFLSEFNGQQVATQEPFGYFKRDAYGWMDCSKDTEGAVALYEAPQPQAGARDAERVDALYFALEVCSAELFAQCAHQGRAMKYVEQARKALAAEQCHRAAIAAKGKPADALDAQRYRWLRSQPLESDSSMFCTTIWRKGTDGFGDDLRLEKLDAAIDAAIAKATGREDSADGSQKDKT